MLNLYQCGLIKISANCTRKPLSGLSPQLFGLKHSSWCELLNSKNTHRAGETPIKNYHGNPKINIECSKKLAQIKAQISFAAEKFSKLLYKLGEALVMQGDKSEGQDDETTILRRQQSKQTLWR